jgi:hypothetical protein
MNERIKKLIDQATVPVVETNDYNGMAYETYQFSQELFAELIIEKFAYELMDLHGSSPEHIIYAAKRYGVEL